MDIILEFIKVFRSTESTELFTEIACYWFSIILCNRFSNARVVYNPSRVHFAAKIGSHVYDITGIVEDEEDYEDWSDYLEYADDADLIIQNCINIRGVE